MQRKYFMLLAFCLLTLVVAWPQEQLTFLFYADTREDPLANWSQKDHEKFVKKVLENEKNLAVDQLIFGGDNVWLGFSDSSWERFFEIMANFRQKNIRIYPALGNHELILSKTLYNQLTREFPEYYGESRDLGSYEQFMVALEESYRSPTPSQLCLQIRQVYGAVEQESRAMLYTMENPGPMSTSWDRFKKYCDAWPYLNEIVPQGRTYYSFLLPIGKTGLAVKVVVLDSNNMNDAAQQAWFKTELGFGSGPVVVISHHPAFYPEKNWDKVPQLWLCGHHHDYERRSLDSQGTTAPIHIISGSGGAPLKGGSPNCNDDKTRVHKNWYNYCRVTVNAQTIRITTFGCAKVSDNLSQIDDLQFPWQQ